MTPETLADGDGGDLAAGGGAAPGPVPAARRGRAAASGCRRPAAEAATGREADLAEAAMAAMAEPLFLIRAGRCGAGCGAGGARLARGRSGGGLCRPGGGAGGRACRSLTAFPHWPPLEIARDALGRGRHRPGPGGGDGPRARGRRPRFWPGPATARPGWPSSPATGRWRCCTRWRCAPTQRRQGVAGTSCCAPRRTGRGEQGAATAVAGGDRAERRRPRALCSPWDGRLWDSITIGLK